MEAAGIFLGPIYERLFDKLVSCTVSSNYCRQEEINRQLKKLEKILPDIRAVLADAEQKQATDDRVKSWMEDLNDLAYDLDDLLDDFAAQTLRHELIMAESQASTSPPSKVRKLIPTCFTRFSTPSAVKLDHNMMSKVEEITTRLEDIETRKNSLDLKDNVGGIRSNTVRERQETTSLVDKSQVYGREIDKEAILQLLLRDEASLNKVSVIPIVGMGGIGKTTLTQLVYDDERLEHRFDFKAWVCVSDDFDVLRVTKRILEAVTSKTHELLALNMLQRKLKDKLLEKRFLLVLDDVWNEKYEDWELLQRPLMFGARGSKIIVTTRHEAVASTMSLSPTYRLNELSKDECLSLFAHHALGRANFDAHPHLKGVGEKIVKKCKGLPLVAKTLGGLLRNKPRQREWENILHSNIWDLPEQKSDILPALRLSYHYLPSHLKQCFAYCAIFPKDYEFDKDELVLLWMGVGLLQLSKEKKRMEDYGDECFDDLLSRSFFQQSGGNRSQFVMHDLLNDLALHVAGDICFRLDKWEGNQQFEIPQRARHLSYIRQRFEVIQRFKPLFKVQHLRTFLALPVQVYNWKDCYVANKVLFDLLPKLQCLRVLSLSGYSITELPDSIGDLKHLRYLNLSGTSIRRLPESVSTLCINLQTLLLRSCKNLCMLPSNIGKLVNLHHLDISDTVQLREMPSGIGRLTNLQTLSKFIVGENNGSGIKELKNLRLLRGSICITELQNVMDLRDAIEANLRVKEDLEELVLAWCCEFNHFRNENLEFDVLDKLQSHRNLKRIKISFYGGINFPSWIGDPSFSEMVNLSLVNCRKCKSLPPLGQLPLLKELCIRGMHEVQNLGVEFYGDLFPLGLPFPSLETLVFEDMPAWEEWSSSISIGVEEAGRKFPCLREITIRNCPKLLRISLLRLPSLQRLNLEKCQEVVLKSMVDLTSLISLTVDSIIGLSYFKEALLQSLLALESLWVYRCNQLVALWQNGGRLTQKNNLARLRRLAVESCPQLVSFGEELDDEGMPCINLEELHINNCVNLEKLPNELNNLTSLTSFWFIDCPKFVCFPKMGVPPTLRKLRMENCNALKSLPDGICGLERLHIERCSSLTCWPINMLPTALKYLYIDGMNLEHFSKVSDTTIMPQQQNIMSSLDSLIISNWPNIQMLLLGVGGCINNNNFATLRQLCVYHCVNLRFFLTTNQILQSLEFLRIEECQSLESIPERGSCLSTPNLRSLYIRFCSNLRWLPIFYQSLQSLESIEIYGCPCLESFPQGNWNLPPNLTKLSIKQCGKVLKPLSEWGLHRLTSLRQFSVEGGYPELVSFPFREEDDDDDDNANDKYCPLPATLTSLSIEDLPNLESISSKGLQNLTSIQHLYIRNCPKLRSLPKEGLPSTLQSLQSGNCPLLKKRCLEDGGDYWPNIAHIPYVRIETDYFYYWNLGL